MVALTVLCNNFEQRSSGGFRSPLNGPLPNTVTVKIRKRLLPLLKAERDVHANIVCGAVGVAEEHANLKHVHLVLRKGLVAQDQRTPVQLR